MHTAPAFSIAANLLALFLVLAGPIWDYATARSLKAHPTASGRLGYYRQTAAWLWIASATACWAYGLPALTTLHGIGVRAAWLDRHPWGRILLVALAIVCVVVQLIVPIVQVTVKYRKRPFLEPRQFEPLRFFLPASRRERYWFGVLSVTAGFTEELLFRGFLLRYLHASALHLPFVWAALAAALIFGAHHLYQGLGGFVSTAIGGLVFTAILLATGSLWAGMAYHAAVDLSLLLYWRPKPADADAGSPA